ncbi:MAG: RNase adapter RapZ [Deltaproteobacteria bacterium]|nr:RNase adapter RapZ [Deltaproteobacteria bacterium]
MKLVVITGVSGAGKTTVKSALEDLGFYCVDNLPIALLPRFIELLAGREEVTRAGLVVDARSGDLLTDTSRVLADLRAAGHSIDVLFLDAPDEVLLRRFSETRRRHPLHGKDIRSDIEAERTRLTPLRVEATAIIDTGDLNVHGLRAIVLGRYGRAEGNLAVTVMSFGFKYGLPTEADIVLDVRFLPNPFFVSSLSALSGEAEAVKNYVMDSQETRLFLEKAEELLTLCVAAFEREGKTYATIAVGCTGGRHRSVVIADELGRRLRNFQIEVKHRDVARGRPALESEGQK